MTRSMTFRQEFWPMLGLAWPLVLTNLSWIVMGLVDTMMVGRVSAVAIGAVSLGGVVFFTVATFGVALLLGLDSLVPQAFGAGNLADCRRSLVNGFYLCLPLALILMAAIRLLELLLAKAGINAAVLASAIPYIRALDCSIPPLLLFALFGGYLRGMNLVKPAMFAGISANLINACGDWILIYGHCGFPKMGAEGSGWATTLARIYMALVVVGYTLWHEHRQARLPGSRQAGVAAGDGLALDLVRIRRLVSLGLPASVQTVVEVAVFAVATALVGTLSPEWLTAHQIAMQMATFTQALGRGDGAGARHAGWTALAVGVGFMGAAALAFLIFPSTIVRIFTPEAAVIRAGAALLTVAAFFQLFDGIQTVVTGALRGSGDTRTPMICHFVAYWLIGLPLGYVLCFNYRMGARGLWIGLSLALILIGLALLGVWIRRVRSFEVVPVAALQE
ncbi:MAG: MATE family efflux transporter [Acidobacteria bacterium]|nr:MAG: MATE family efflux transporter [Acidobacteriota bacterium]